MSLFNAVLNKKIKSLTNNTFPKGKIINHLWLMLPTEKYAEEIGGISVLKIGHWLNDFLSSFRPLSTVSMSVKGMGKLISYLTALAVVSNFKQAMQSLLCLESPWTSSLTADKLFFNYQLIHGAYWKLSIGVCGFSSRTNKLKILPGMGLIF